VLKTRDGISALARSGEEYSIKREAGGLPSGNFSTDVHAVYKRLQKSKRPDKDKITINASSGRRENTTR